MRQPSYTNERLLELARQNYMNLCDVCKALDSEGYWEQPSQVLNRSILDFLDLYVQAILINLAVYCGRLKEDEKSFIINVSKKNLAECTLDGTNDEEVILMVKNIIKSPPILLQLCGVRDVEKNSDFTVQFFDSFLNILLSMSRLNNAKDSFVNAFIQEYYEKVSIFINSENVKEAINPRYIFRKLSCERLEEQLEFFLEPREPKRSPEKESLLKETILKDELPYGDSVWDEEEDEDEAEAEENLSELDESDEWENEADLLELEEQEEITSVFDTSFEKDSFSGEGMLLEESPSIRLEQELKEYQEENLIEEIEVLKPKSKLDQYLEELDSLVGLEGVKAEINSLINLIKVRKMRESFNMPTMEMTYHMVFTGNPGTGKTTVARLVSKIYRELGLLSKGTLIETDRSGLVAGYVGQTALKVKETIERAIGGVLFIDEAYSLSNNVANDFGGEAIDTLVKMMEDHRDNLVVIVAGYKDEMKTFLEANTGLVSRFNKFIEFEDYSVMELMDILVSMAGKAGITLEEDARVMVNAHITDFTKEEFRRFGNARGIRNLFEKLMINQANRIVTIEEPTMEQLSVLTEEDVLETLG